MSIEDLPIEIVEKILLGICDNDTYRNSRMVCKEWYNILNILRNFDDKGNIISRIIFDNKYIKCIDNSDKLKFEYILSEYGNNVYREYNGRGTLIKKINIELPNYVNFWMVKNNMITTRKYDIRKDDITTTSVPILPFHPNCNIM